MENIIYIIDYSSNSKFREKCFDLLRYEIESKIIFEAKYKMEFILSSISTPDYNVENEFGFEGIYACPTEFDTKRSGLDTKRYQIEIPHLEKVFASANQNTGSDLNEAIMLAMDKIRNNPAKFKERSIYILSDFETKFGKGHVSKIQEKLNQFEIKVFCVSDGDVPPGKLPPYCQSVPIDTILKNSKFCRKRGANLNRKFEIQIGPRGSIKVILQNSLKAARSRIGKIGYSKELFEENNGITLEPIEPFYTFKTDKETDDSDEGSDDDSDDDIASQLNSQAQDYTKMASNKISADDVTKKTFFEEQFFELENFPWREELSQKKGFRLVGTMKLEKLGNNFVGKQTQEMRGQEENDQEAINSLAEYLQSENMAFIATYKYSINSVPKICCLQAKQAENDSFSFLMKYLPSNASFEKIPTAKLKMPDPEIDSLISNYIDALDLDELWDDDESYKTELLNGYDVHIDVARRVLFKGEPAKTDIFKFQHDRFQLNPDLDNIISKIGIFREKNRPKYEKRARNTPKPQNSQNTQNVQNTQKTQGTKNIQQTASPAPKRQKMLDDVTNVENDTATVCPDSSTLDKDSKNDEHSENQSQKDEKFEKNNVNNEEGNFVTGKGSPNHSIADSGMGSSLAPSLTQPTQKYSQFDDESDWSDGDF